MSRPSMLDSKYSGLSANEMQRQYDRDVMMWEQTEQLKRANDLKEKSIYGETPLSPTEEALYNSKLFTLWFCTFVFGGVIIGVNYTTDIQIKLPGGIVPLYIYIGILVIIPIIAIIKGIINNISNSKRRKEIEKEKPDIERQIRKLQRDLDDLELDAKTEKDRIDILNTQLRLAMMDLDIEKENKLKNEIKNSNSKMYDIEEKQKDIEEKIEALENKIS